MRKAARAFLFDMDGVLLDSGPVHAVAYHKAFAEVGVAFDVERFEREFSGVPRARVIELVMGAGASPQERERVFVRKGELVDEALVREGAPAHEGAGDLLERVRAEGILLALVTTSRAPEAFVSHHRWAPWFDVIVSGRDIIHPKPAPDPYLLAARQLGVDASQCVAVEDSPLGLESAVSAGARAYAVATTHTREALIDAGALEVFDGLESLGERLLRGTR